LALRPEEAAENRDLQARFEANVAQLRSRLKSGHADSIPGSAGCRVLLVPGWDHRANGKATGSDFAQPRKLLTRVGMDNRLIEIDPVGSVERNAKDVAEAVARAQDSGKSLILAGNSLGRRTRMTIRKKGSGRLERLKIYFESDQPLLGRKGNSNGLEDKKHAREIEEALPHCRRHYGIRVREAAGFHLHSGPIGGFDFA
jgi:hypothetical protein